MESNNTTRVIALIDLWNIFVSRLIWMVLAAVIAVGAAFAYNTATYVPKYKSTATLYILKQGEDNTTSTDFSLALNVVSDCTFILKSHAVLDAVISELHLDIPYATVMGGISTNNPEKTRILEVSYTGDSPEQAKQIVDCICKIGCERIEEAMGFKQTNFYEFGTINKTPNNRTGLKTYLLIGLGAAAIIYAIFLLAFLLDDSIRTDEDITNYLGITVLGDIPNADDNSGGSYSKYGYRKYGYRKYGKTATAAKEEEKKS